MTFVIITHVPHIIESGNFFAYSPYVREMNIWLKYVDKVIIVAPVDNAIKSAIHLKYDHSCIEFVSVENFDVMSIKAVFKTVFKIPHIIWSLFKVMGRADHIHLRSPGNIGLLGLGVQVFFPSKVKTAKYAGNWDPKSNQPLSYKLQQWILKNTFLTRNIQVLVYGNWKNSTKNIKSFFTASFRESDKLPILEKLQNGQIHFVFVGTLVKGKNPMYALEIIKSMFESGINVVFNFYGDGPERNTLEKYVQDYGLEKIVHFNGNQTQQILIEAYKNSDFVILPSESEGWPKVIAEGMFWGCVPVSTAVSCVPFMLDHGKRGVLLTMDPATDLKQIVSLITEGGFNDKSKLASEWARKYTLDSFEKEIMQLLSV